MKLGTDRHLSLYGMKGLCLALATGIMLSATPCPAVVQGPEPAHSIHAPELRVAPSPVRVERGSEAIAQRPGLEEFLELHTDGWRLYLDQRSDRPTSLEVAGVPILPSRCNNLTRQELALDHDRDIEIEDVAELLRQFMATFPAVLRVADMDLRLNRASSSSSGRERWSVFFQQYHGDVPVHGAYALFRIGCGNLTQFGTNLLTDIDQLSPEPLIDRAQALARVLEAMQLADDEIAGISNPGTLKIFPTSLPGESPTEGYRGEPGKGYRHVLAWEIHLSLADDPAAYRARVDAHDGRVIELFDLTVWAGAPTG